MTRAGVLAIGVCGCPHVHLIVMGHDGQELARVSWSPEQALQIARDIAGVAERAIASRSGKPAIGDCLGSA